MLLAFDFTTVENFDADSFDASYKVRIVGLVSTLVMLNYQCYVVFKFNELSEVIIYLINFGFFVFFIS